MSIKDDILKHKILSYRLITGLVHPYRVLLKESLKDGTKKPKIRKGIHNIQQRILKQLAEYSIHTKKTTKKILKKYLPEVVGNTDPISVEDTKIKLSIPSKPVKIKKAFEDYNVFAESYIDRSFTDAELIGEPVKPDSITGRLVGAFIGLIATMLDGVGGYSREDIYKENNIELFIWVAVLDSATCETCASYDALPPFEYKDAPDIPKVHINCRCEIIPVIEENN